MTGLGLAALVAGCGGGTTASVGDPPGGGIGGTGSVAVVAQGPITGFGSIVVNGIEFELGPAAVVYVNGAETSEEDLRMGMVVRVEGQYAPDAAPTPLGYTPGQAERVEYASEVKGPADVDDAGNVSVLGRRVAFSPDTRFEGLGGPQEIRAGDVLEVSGLVAPDGGILATYVRLERYPSQEVKLRGPVANLDTESGVFEIRGQLVRFGQHTDLRLELHDGAEVRVEGWIGPDGVVDAERIEPAPGGLPDGQRAEVEGVVGWVEVQGSRFSVDGVEVDASGARFEKGTWSDLAPGARVEVEGVMRSGVLVAEEVEIKARGHASGHGDDGNPGEDPGEHRE